MRFNRHGGATWRPLVNLLICAHWVLLTPVGGRSRRDSGATMHTMATIPVALVQPRPLAEVPKLVVPLDGVADFPAFYHNNFHTGPYSNKAPISFGGIVNNLKDGDDGAVDPESPEGQSVLAGLFKELQLDQSMLVKSEESPRLRRIPLRVANDHGRNGLTMPAYYSMDGTAIHRFTWNVTLGTNYWVQFVLNHQADTGKLHQVKHSVGTSIDLRYRSHNIMQHTHCPLAAEEEETVEVEVDPDGKPSAVSNKGKSDGPNTQEVRIMSYNVWNTNPPHWVYESRRERVDRYGERMDLLCQYIVEANPDIVAFQEVRFDSGMVDTKTGKSNFQMKHLSARLQEHGYSHFVWQPAMLYFDPTSISTRVEEGAAIFSKHPITHTDYLLLPRYLDDNDDKQHQRAVVHARVVLPNGEKVDVFSTHLSLCEKARDSSVRAMWDFVRTNTSASGKAFLLGDLNAEPQSAAMKFLSEKMDDTWLVHGGQEEPEPRSKDPKLRQDSFTFPSDDPKKRIDYIFAHGIEKSEQGKDKIEVLGQAPTERTKGDPGHGMLDKDSPLYASDHRAIMLTVEI